MSYGDIDFGEGGGISLSAVSTCPGRPQLYLLPVNERERETERERERERERKRERGRVSVRFVGLPSKGRKEKDGREKNLIVLVHLSVRARTETNNISHSDH
jgi:hypothetical protein